MDFKELVATFLDLIAGAVPVIFALTLLFVFWKVARAWIIGGGDPYKVEEGKKTILVGVIALVVMTSVWALVRILHDSLF